MSISKSKDIIKKNLVAKADSKASSYSLKDLLKSGIPPVLVEQIRIILQEEIRNTWEMPKSNWVDSEHRLVAEAWDDFMSVSVSHSFVPKSQLKHIIGKAVDVLLDVYLQPEKNIVEYLYGNNEELTLEELVERMRILTVYKHFASAIPMYMKKRNLDSLSKERCSMLIHNLDEKLVATYTPSQWFQKLELLFELCNDNVDVSLLALFFEDKGSYKVAKYFTNLGGTVNKEDFLDVVSSPGRFEAINAIEFDEEKEVLIIRKKTEQISEEEEEEQNLLDSFFGEYEYRPLAEEAASASDTKDSVSLADSYQETIVSESEMNELVNRITELQAGLNGRPDQTEDEIAASLNNWYADDEAAENLENLMEETAKSNIPKPIQTPTPKKKAERREEYRANSESISSIIERAAFSLNELDEEDKPADEETEMPEKEKQKTPPKPDAAKKDDVVFELDKDGMVQDSSGDSEEESGTESESAPVWQQFLSKDQINLVMGDSGEEPSEEPILNSSFSLDDEDDDEEKISDEAQALLDALQPDMELYVDQIFLGAEHAYREAVIELAALQNWKKISGYIEINIFKRNQVDMLSAIAVRFTDNLQTYFNSTR